MESIFVFARPGMAANRSELSKTRKMQLNFAARMPDIRYLTIPEKKFIRVWKKPALSSR